MDAYLPFWLTSRPVVKPVVGSVRTKVEVDMGEPAPNRGDGWWFPFAGSRM